MPGHAVVLQDTRPYKAAAPQILPFFLSLGNQRKAKEKHAERSQQPGALLIPAVPPCCQLQPPAAPAALCAPRLESGCISQPPANWAQLRLLSIPIGGEKLSKYSRAQIWVRQTCSCCVVTGGDSEQSTEFKSSSNSGHRNHKVFRPAHRQTKCRLIKTGFSPRFDD